MLCFSDLSLIVRAPTLILDTLMDRRRMLEMRVRWRLVRPLRVLLSFLKPKIWQTSLPQKAEREVLLFFNTEIFKLITNYVLKKISGTA